MFIYFICIYLYLCLYLYISLLMFMGLSYLCICFSVLNPPQDMDETRCTEGWQWYHGWGLHAMQSSTQSERWEDSFCPDSPYWCSNGWRVIETSCVWCLFFWGVWASSMAWPMQRFCGMFKCKLNPRRVWKHWNQNSIWSPEWNWRKTSFTSCSDRGVPWCPILINKCSITWTLVKFCDWVLFPFFPRSYLQQCCPLISGFAHHCSDSP